MNQNIFIGVKFSEGLGIFDDHYGYPEIDDQETYNGPTGKVVDIQGPQAHAGRNFFVPEGKEFSFDIDECPYLHIAIKAEEGTNTCLILCVHDKGPREHIRRHVVIGKTPDGNPGIYDVIKNSFEIKDDGEWHEYDFDLRMIREKQDDTYPYYPDAGSISIIQFYSWTGTGEHAFHFNDLLFKQESQPPISEHPELSSLQEMLKARLPDELSRLDTTRIWLESRRNPDQFLARIAENPQLSSRTDAILFTLEVADRVGGHPGVIRAMERRFDAGEFPEAGDIVKLDKTEWEDLLRKESIEVPDSFKKGDENASVSAFADHLKTTFERAYPKQAIRSHFDRHADSYAWGKSVSDILKTNKSLDPSRPVVCLEREHPELFKEEVGKEARRGLAAFQRLHRLTGRLDSIKPLVDARLTSARAIAQTDPAEFANRFASAFGGSVNEAATMHVRAIHASSLAKLTFSTLSEQFNTTPFAVLGSPGLSDEQSQALSTWRKIFGSEDLGFCECAHCKSIFGPAAYLFDMLLFLDQFTALSQQLGHGHHITALEFLNCVEQPEHIVNWVQDDPAFPVGSENTIGISLDVATRILQKREALGGRFSIMHQLYDIKGVGPNSLHDMIHTSWGEAGPIAIELALEFLNSVSEAWEIKYRIKHHPEYRIKHHPEYRTWDTSVLPWVAEPILDHRDSMEVGGTFTSLSQVADVPCVGPDTLHDIIYSFYIKADQLVVDWLYVCPTNKVVALAEFNGRLFGATSDNELMMRDAIPEDLPWHLIGFVNNVTALSFSNGRLFAATDDGIWMSDPSTWVTAWDEIGDAKNVVSMTALNGKLYAATSDNTLLIEKPTYTEDTWQHIENFMIFQPKNVVGMAELGGKLYAATSDKGLFIGELSSTSVSWKRIGGYTNNVVGMTALDGKLYAATSDNKLLIGEPTPHPANNLPPSWDPTYVPWTPIGHANNVVALAAADGLLFAATSDHRLLMRQATETDQPWIHIGTAPNVVGITTMDGNFYAATSDNRLVLERHPPKEVPRISVASVKGIIAMTAYINTLYVVHNNRLCTRNIASSEAQWTDIGPAYQITAIASQQGRLVAATENDRLLTRNFAPEAPWTDVGHAKGAVAMAATNYVLFTATGNNELWMHKLPALQSLLDKFRQRRPDVPALLLSCDNTNIEVPHIDLVNELLADLIYSSICFGMHQSAGSSNARSTTGTSEERRAWPEHKPSKSVLVKLTKATRPWMLPYDYERDQAEQARRALPVEGNEVIEAVWRFEALSEASDGSTTPLTHAWSLAQYALNLTEAEIELISGSGSSLLDMWGNEVASTVASGKSPTVAALQRAGRFDFTVLEDLLETKFVRQATLSDAIRLQPAGCCDPEQLRLNVPVDDLPAILDHLHRFERLRRKCGWSSIHLDNVLGATDHALGRNELLAVGLVVFLQQRLGLSPDAVLALFCDPSSQRPFTLRSDKRVLSPFERLFGTEPVLPALTGDDAADVNTADVVVANIAARVGVGSDEVRFVLSKGYAGIGDIPFTDPVDILRANNPLEAWRAAVAGVFRVTTFAEALGVSLTDFIALVELSNANFLLRPGIECKLSQQLIDAISLVNLAHDASSWPLSASEVLYLTTTDDFASRVHAPDAIKSGDLLKRLQAEVSRASEAFVTAGTAVTKVQNVLSELLGEASLQRLDGQSVPEKAIDRIQRMIEWSSVFPGFKAQIIASLPAGAVLETEVLYPDSAELETDGKEWKDVLDIKDKYLFSWEDISGNDDVRLREFLNQNFGIDWVETANIERIDNGKTIKISTQKNYLLLKLNDEQTEVNLEIDDVRTDKFEVKIENNKVNIYEDKASVLPELLRRHLAQVSDATGVNKSDSEYQSIYKNVLQALRDETEATVCDPGLVGVGRLSNEIQPLLTLMDVPTEELEAKAKTLASALLASATRTVSSRMESVRTRAAQRWLPALTAAALRSKLDTSAIQLLANAFSLDTAEARLLLSQLLRDPDHDQALLRAFVSRDGSTEQVDASLVQASYLNLEESSGSSSAGDAVTATTAPSEVQLVVNRIEPSLQIDWAASPPPAGINTERFQVNLTSLVATAALKTGSGIRRLVVESTGHVTMSLRAGYLFSWDEIPGNDEGRLLEYLVQKFGFNWVKTAKIEKIDDGRIIKVSVQDDYLSLKLNDEKTKVNLEIDNVRDEFIASTENTSMDLRYSS